MYDVFDVFNIWIVESYLSLSILLVSPASICQQARAQTLWSFFNEAGQESGRDCSCCKAVTHQVCPHCGICPCSWRERRRLARNIMHNREGISKIKQSEEWTEKDEPLGKTPAIILPAARAPEEAKIQENAVGTLGPERKNAPNASCFHHIRDIESALQYALLSRFFLFEANRWLFLCCLHTAVGKSKAMNWQKNLQKSYDSKRIWKFVNFQPDVQSEASTSMSVDKSSMHRIVHQMRLSSSFSSFSQTRASFHAILSQIEWQTLANHYKTLLTMPEIATPKYRSTSTQPRTSKAPGRCCWPQALWKSAGGAARAWVHHKNVV